jgi:hypothetical protein
MANNIFTATLSGNSNNSLTGITVNAVFYPLSAPITLDVTISGIAAAIQNQLNGLGFGAIFTVTIVSTNFVITSNCVPQTISSATTYPGGVVNFSGAVCGAIVACTNVTATVTGSLVVSCTNGIFFTDTTGAYSSSNIGGYGTPNAPAIGDITGTVFKLYDSTGSTLIGTFTSSYIPDPSGTVGITLIPGNFGLTQFDLNKTYKLSYSLLWSSNTSTCLVDTFTQPCCGGLIQSSLLTNFGVQENVGNTSITFTDTTGSYDPSTNPGGYGGPNYNYSDITSTLIVISLSNGTVINVTNFIPTALNPSITLTGAFLGYQSTIPDQIIQIAYYVYTGSVCQIGYKNQSLLLYGMSQACVNGQILSLLNGDCSCNTENCDQTDYITKMLFELDAIVIASQGNIGCVQGKIEAFYNKCTGGCSAC